MPPTANPADPKTLQDLIAALGNVDGTIQILKDRGNFNARLETDLNELRDDLESEAAALFTVPAGEPAMVIEDDVSGALYLAAVKDGKPVIVPVVPKLASEVPLKSDAGTPTTPPDTGTPSIPPVDTGTPPVDSGMPATPPVDSGPPPDVPTGNPLNPPTDTTGTPTDSGTDTTGMGTGTPDTTNPPPVTDTGVPTPAV